MKYPRITAKAPGKLILLGEYAVLEGAPALVTAIDRFCTVSIRRNGHSVFGLESRNLDMPTLTFHLDESGRVKLAGGSPFASQKQTGFLVEVINYVASRYEGTIPGAYISIDSGDFYHQTSGNKFGLGSSAALTVALIRAMNELMGKTTSSELLFSEAIKAHRAGQGRLGSGVDVAASAAGGVIAYRMPKSEEDIPDSIRRYSWPEGLYMTVVWTGNSASTRFMLEKVKLFRQHSSDLYDGLLENMAEVATEGCEAFAAGDATRFTKVVPRYLEQEERLGAACGIDIISPSHRNLKDLITRAGGVYKPSGAGGGDIGVAFTDNEEIHSRIRKVLQQSPYQILDIEVEPAEHPYGIYTDAGTAE